MFYLLRGAVVLEGAVQRNAIAGQQVEAVQPEEALHAKAIAWRHHNRSPIGTFSVDGLEQVDVVIVCKRVDINAFRRCVICGKLFLSYFPSEITERCTLGSPTSLATGHCELESIFQIKRIYPGLLVHQKS